MHGNVLEEHQDTLHAAGGHVEIDIPEDVDFVSAYFSVPQYPVIQDRKAAFVLVVDHAGQLWLSDHFVLQTDFSNTVRGVGITCGLDHAAVVVKGEFIFEAVSERALVKLHEAFQQLEIKRDVEAVAERIGNGFVRGNCLIFISNIDSNTRCVSVIRRINTLIQVIIPLWGCLPEIVVTVVNITVVDGRHLDARNFYCGLFHDGAAYVLNYCPVDLFTIKRDSEGQADSPWDDDVICAQVGEPNKQLLVLVKRARVVSDDHGLPHAFDTQGLAEAPTRIKLAFKFVRSHGVFEPTQQPSNEHPPNIYAAMDDVTFENPTFDPDGPGIGDDYAEHSLDLSDAIMDPPLDVQQQLNTSGDRIQNMREELRQIELEAKKKRLVDTFYKEENRAYGLRPEGSIDYNQFGIGADGKTFYWTPDDKKIPITVTRGNVQFLALGTLARRYGNGGPYALRRSQGLTDYRSGVSRLGTGNTLECRGNPPEKHWINRAEGSLRRDQRYY